jgi:hypothetical protein
MTEAGDRFGEAASTRRVRLNGVKGGGAGGRQARRFGRTAVAMPSMSGRQVEINNGRLAMLGIISFLAESKALGAVPLLSGLIP